MEPTHRTLVLSQSYEPVKIVSWQQAITLLFLGKVEVIEEYDRDIKTTSLVIKIPAVVRLLSAFRRAQEAGEVLARSTSTAATSTPASTAATKKSIGELTYDHVVPRAQGGKTTWTNIATCCEDCNRKKANRTPEQAGMRLRKVPVQPTATPVLVVAVSRESVPDAWRDYLYWTSELDAD